MSAFPQRLQGAETNRWLVGDYWGERVDEKEREEISFQRRREVFVVELNEKWDAHATHKQTHRKSNTKAEFADAALCGNVISYSCQLTFTLERRGNMSLITFSS